MRGSRKRWGGKTPNNRNPCLLQLFTFSTFSSRSVFFFYILSYAKNNSCVFRSECWVIKFFVRSLATVYWEDMQTRVFTSGNGTQSFKQCSKYEAMFLFRGFKRSKTEIGISAIKRGHGRRSCSAVFLHFSYTQQHVQNWRFLSVRSSRCIYVIFMLQMYFVSFVVV